MNKENALVGWQPGDGEKQSTATQAKLGKCVATQPREAESRSFRLNQDRRGGDFHVLILRVFIRTYQIELQSTFNKVVRHSEIAL